MKSKSELVEVDEKIHPIAVHQDPYMSLIQVAVEKDVDIEKIEKLMNLQDRYEAKNARKSFFASLSAFQSDLPVIGKRGQASFGHKSGGGTTEYDFAKLEDIALAIRPHLVKHGLSYRFEMGNNNGLFKVICIVTHLEGHEERTEMEAFADNSGKKNNIQQIASTQSYLKRYTLTAALGVIVGGEDDDAQSYQEPEQEAIHTIFPDDSFESVFPKWEKLILDGKQTPEQIITRGNNKNIFFSENQLEKIQNVGKA